MNIFQTIKAFTSDDEAKSGTLVSNRVRLEAQMADAVKRKMAMDPEAINLGIQLAGAREARSPRLADLQIELDTKISERDKKEGELEEAIRKNKSENAKLTSPLAQQFNEYGLARIKNLVRFYRERQTGKFSQLEDRGPKEGIGRDVTYLQYQDNRAVLKAQEEKILAAVADVKGKVETHSLSALRSLINDYIAVFDEAEENFDVMTSRTVSQAMARADRADRKPDLIDGAAVDDLTHRISKLEKNL